MHLEKNILKGRFGKNKELKNEARSELKEMQSLKSRNKALERMKHRVGVGHSKISGKSYKHD